jgi:hypothetical protein
MKRFVSRLIQAPGCQTIFSIVFPVISGILGGTFVAEISNTQGLQWNIFYKTWSFYFIIFLIILVYYYNRTLYLIEKDISRFSDTTYCKAYIRSKCLPEITELYKDMIRSGRSDEISKATRELRNILE